MKNFFIRLSTDFNDEVWLVKDVYTDAIASGTKDYVALTQYLLIDSNGIVKHEYPRNVSSILSKEEIRDENLLDYFKDYLN